MSTSPDADRVEPRVITSPEHCDQNVICRSSLGQTGNELSTGAMPSAQRQLLRPKHERSSGNHLHLLPYRCLLISKWLGHRSAKFTMGVCVYGQDDALTAAGETLASAVVRLSEINVKRCPIDRAGRAVKCRSH